MEEEKEAINEEVSELLSTIVGAGGIMLQGLEEGTFAMVGNSALAIVVAESSGGKQFYRKQEVIVLSAIESVKIGYPQYSLPVKITLQSGAVEYLNLKVDADTGVILNLLVRHA